MGREQPMFLISRDPSTNAVVQSPALAKVTATELDEVHHNAFGTASSVDRVPVPGTKHRVAVMKAGEVIIYVIIRFAFGDLASSASGCDPVCLLARWGGNIHEFNLPSGTHDYGDGLAMSDDGLHWIRLPADKPHDYVQAMVIHAQYLEDPIRHGLLRGGSVTYYRQAAGLINPRDPSQCNLFTAKMG